MWGIQRFWCFSKVSFGGWKVLEVEGKRDSGLRRSSGVQVRLVLVRRERRRCRRMIKSGTGVLLDYKELKDRWRNKKLYEGDGVMNFSEGMMACVSREVSGKERGRSFFFKYILYVWGHQEFRF